MTQSAYSQTSSRKNSLIGFSAYAQAGILYGQSEEIVFQNSQDTDYLSQLLWDLKPLVYAGAGLSFSLNERRDPAGFYIDLSFKAGIPAVTGIMEDRDWMDSGDLDHLTNYSVHNNYTTQAFLTDFALGVSLPLKYQDRNIAFLNIETALSHRYFNWVGRDGYYQYESFNWEARPLDGDVIAYYQHWFTVSPGMALTIPMWSQWLAKISLNVSPGWIWCWDRDTHIVKKTEYYDYLTGGFLLDSSLKVSYSVNAHLALEGTVSYRYTRGSRGDILTVVDGQRSSWSNDQAGTGFHALDAGLIFKVFF
jgi:outer membrane protease